MSSTKTMQLKTNSRILRFRASFRAASSLRLGTRARGWLYMTSVGRPMTIHMVKVGQADRVTAWAQDHLLRDKRLSDLPRDHESQLLYHRSIPRGSTGIDALRDRHARGTASVPTGNARGPT